MKRDVFILNCPEVELPPSLVYVFDELCGYFRDNGYKVAFAKNINELHNNSVVFMGDFFHHPKPGALLHAQAPDAIYIGWYWHAQDVSMLKYFIYTYENCLYPDGLDYNVQRFAFFKKQLNKCPLLLRANDDPEKIGMYIKNIKYDYCFMGGRYHDEMIPSGYNGLFHGVYDPAQYLDYNTRKQIYLSSHFALGFQSFDNVKSKHVSQRIYEGLAYGCIVLSESLPACEQTEGIVQHVTSKSDVENKMKWFLEHPEEMEVLRKKGYAFTKKYGTNRYSIEIFRNVIKNCFQIDIISNDLPTVLPLKHYIYYHICCIGDWKNIVTKTFTDIKNSGLYNLIDKIRCVILDASGESDFFELFNDPKIQIILKSPILELRERVTINKIYEASLKENFYVLYLHSKGVTRSGEKGPPVLAWAEYMKYFTITLHKKCIEFLGKYDAVGVNLVSIPSPHFSGNFWWSKSAYLRNKRECTEEDVKKEIIMPELWIGASPCTLVGLFDLSRYSPYYTVYQPEWYTNRPLELNTICSTKYLVL